MKKILTKKAQARLDRNKLIAKEYKKTYSDGSHVTAVCEEVGVSLGYKTSLVHRVVKTMGLC